MAEIKAIMELVKRLGKSLGKKAAKSVTNELTGEVDITKIILYGIIAIIVLFVYQIILLVGTIMAIWNYFLCSGLFGWFTDCKNDPISNEDVSNLAKRMYEQRRDAGVTVSGGLFRLKSESLLVNGGTSAGIPTLVGNGNAQQVWNHLKQDGFSDQSAAGIMGNFQQESGFDPKADPHDGSGSIGLAQWLGSRKQGLVNFSQAQGVSFLTLEAQLGWFDQEINTGYKKISDSSFKQLTDVTQATQQFEKIYEGASTPDMSKRVQYANDALKSFGGTGGNTSAGTTPPASTTTGTALGDQVVAIAKKYLAEHGANTGANEFIYDQARRTLPIVKYGDCSSFVWTVFHDVGVTLGTYTGTQVTDPNGKFIPNMSDLKPGDLVFFNFDGTHPVTLPNGVHTGVSHVGIYIGGNQMIHFGSTPLKQSDITTPYYKNAFVGGMRMGAAGTGSGAGGGIADPNGMQPLDEAEIWVRILAQTDLNYMENHSFSSKDFKQGGKYYNTNLSKTYDIAYEDYGSESDFKDKIYYYMMKSRFDIYSCYFLKDDGWWKFWGVHCTNPKIKAYVADADKGVVPMTVKSGNDVLFKYTKLELLMNFAPYSLMDKKEFDQWVEYYLKTMYEGVYGPDVSSVTMPGSAPWIVPMETGTYALTTGYTASSHNGVDLGTSNIDHVPVYAAGGGTVIAAGDNNGGYGGEVLIDHGNGYYSVYGHLLPDDIVVRKGQSVQQGQLIGAVGKGTDSSTSESSDSHLHFEICKATKQTTGTNLSPGSGPLLGCDQWANPADPQFSLSFGTNEDTALTTKRAGQFTGTVTDPNDTAHNNMRLRAIGGDAVNMPGYQQYRLGSLSAKYENAGDPGTCSSGVGDPGGVSCGEFQLATAPGTLASFVDPFLKTEYPQYYNALSPYTAGSTAFVQAWGQTYQSDKTGFEQAQWQFIYETHYLPQVQGIKSTIGLDVTTRARAVQEMTWSMAVQHRNNTPGMFRDALGTGWKSMTDAQIITAVYDLRIQRYPGLSTRFIAEKADCLAMLQ